MQVQGRHIRGKCYCEDCTHNTRAVISTSFICCFCICSTVVGSTIFSNNVSNCIEYVSGLWDDHLGGSSRDIYNNVTGTSEYKRGGEAGISTAVGIPSTVRCECSEGIVISVEPSPVKWKAVCLEENESSRVVPE